MNKVTITYKTSKQYTEDQWEGYTEVVHVSENDTIKEIMETHFKEWGKKVNVELHFELD